jgi:hypothetical protein
MTKKNQTQPWLSQFTENPINQKLLGLFAIRGLATIEQCQSLQSDLSDKQLRSLLANWSQEQAGKTPLLRTLRISYERQRGNPRLVYLLTETGAGLLRQLNGQGQFLVPKLESKVEAVHATAEMDVLVRARQANLDCLIEKPFYYGLQKENIRADIAFATNKNTFRLIEIEQSARADDVSRLTDKLLRLLRFFRSNEAEKVEKWILVLFNLAGDDQQTLSIWQKVIAVIEKQHGPLPFQLQTVALLDFLEIPAWQDWSQYPTLRPEPMATPAQPDLAIDPAMPDLTPPFLKQRPAEASHFDLILEVLKEEVQLQVFEDAEANQRTFFNLALVIYAGSHYPDSPVVRKSAFPAVSLALLYRYLHAAQNRLLLELVKREIREVQHANLRGINLFRDAYSHMAWSFLRYYGFGRGGPLEVQVRVPSFNDERSDIHLQLRWKASSYLDEVYGLTNSLIPKPAPQEELGFDEDFPEEDPWSVLSAAAWLLNAIWIYMDDLGLKPSDSKKRKS